ncbi:MAG: periplasmic heavy metal sensor, partial [Syntrophaceae bacterium]|nr:periplasmic heavy metal sensor [Syntrophaceae bacterium]
MKKTAIGISVVTVFLVTASLALAWGHGYGRGAGFATPSAYGCLYAPNFNLTAEQTGKLTGLQQQFLNETLPIRNELAAKSLELRSLMVQPSPNAAAISAKQKEISALQQKMQEKSLSYQTNARSLLTPQQLSQLPPGCGLGFAAGFGYGAGFRGGYGRGMGYNPGFSGGYGRGRGMGGGPG